MAHDDPGAARRRRTAPWVAAAPPATAAPQHATAPLPTPPAAPPGPVPPGGRGGAGHRVVAAVAVVLLVAGAAGATWLLTRDDEPAPAAVASSFGAPPVASPDEDDDGGATDPVPAPTTSAAPTTSPAPTTPAPPAGVTAVPSSARTENEAMTELLELRAQSLDRLVLDGRWVAQVASKAVGITDPLQVAANGTHTFYALDILAESQDAALRASGPAAVYVLGSTDFGRRSYWTDGQPYWVTVVDEGFSSRDDVELWCARTHPQLSGQQLTNACAPRTLTQPHD
ncbi:hypothetical protein JOD57_002801 [Geodermatophilus bullaregiensis]|uniref:hypothetical protein n=1 Tax=Geodermatophilus bullaregiensis TaxID=1564160 RepID=UPI00195CFBA9|nr:hypothetical protein [Geodermatophilus bullaregiensis]MBM7806964.1 hypothetical protein [Geodermatophilus bullaregiensis]